ncbi:MAG: DUF4864 domain-containing protein [Bacteriovorax sp.]|nr:DUF4864 domain-containing protein [Rhizobacter sp.]
MRRALWILAWLAAGFLPVAAFAAGDADVSERDARSVRSVIQAQLAAFAAGDAKRAFSYATPKVREVFGSADKFIEVVREAYPAVYRHETVAFLKPELADGTLLQGVHLTDGQGMLWLALYRMERQRDRSWRISACQLVPAQGRVA